MSLELRALTQNSVRAGLADESGVETEQSLTKPAPTTHNSRKAILTSNLDWSGDTTTKELSNEGIFCGIYLIDRTLPLHLALVEKHNPVSGAANGAVLVRHHCIGATAAFNTL